MKKKDKIIVALLEAIAEEVGVDLEEVYIKLASQPDPSGTPSGGG